VPRHLRDTGLYVAHEDTLREKVRGGQQASDVEYTRGAGPVETVSPRKRRLTSYYSRMLALPPGRSDRSRRTICAGPAPRAARLTAAAAFLFQAAPLRRPARALLIRRGQPNPDHGIDAGRPAMPYHGRTRKPESPTRRWSAVRQTDSDRLGSRVPGARKRPCLGERNDHRRAVKTLKWPAKRSADDGAVALVGPVQELRCRSPKAN